MKKVFNKIFLITICLFIFIPNVFANVKVDSLDYILKDYGAFDIVGNNGDITTSFGNYGYFTTLKLGSRQIRLYNEGLEDIVSEHLTVNDNDNGKIIYDEEGYGKLVISSVKKNATTIEVTYTLTNYAKEKVSFGLGGSTDVMFGSNDEAAIEKDDEAFLITQDDSISYTTTYGAQLNMTFSPKPTTTWIGHYYNNDMYYEHVFEKSEVNYYTMKDYVDTALNYSWQGEINANETKEFTAIFGMTEAKTVKINFYFINEEGEYDEPTTIEVLGGGAFQLPNIPEEHLEKGSNLKWYLNKNGTDQVYLPNQWVVASNRDISYYEVKKENKVITEKPENKNYAEATIATEDVNKILTDVFGEDAENSYDDVEIILEVTDITDTIIPEEKELINGEIPSNYKMGVYFDANLFKIINNEDATPVSEVDKSLTIKFKLPAKLKNTIKTKKREYQVLRLHDGVVDTIKTTYDEKNGILSFKTNKFSTYALIYKDVPRIDNPSTLDNFGMYLLIGGVSLLLLTGCIIYIKKNN